MFEGGDENARNRHTSRGKMLPRERVTNLLDPGYYMHHTLVCI